MNIVKNFKCDIVADSVNPFDKRITSLILTYPRFIHSELMTHRAFSRNAASSRAIPIEKMITQVRGNPAMPVRWGKNGKGMQDHGEFVGHEIEPIRRNWYYAAESAADAAEELSSMGLHKQIANRVLEPFVWMTTLVTATELENFFSLRVHKDAQPEFQYLAYMMLKTYLGVIPNKLNWGEWHIPFSERMPDGIDLSTKLKIATARAARTSYLTMDGEINIDKDIELHDRLAQSGHWSPFEHSACANEKGSGNFIGWKQYRHTFKMENRKCDLHQLLAEYENNLNSK